MQAIITKYLCPTNARGSRIKASCEAMSVTLSWDDALDQEANHRAACDELCRRMDARNVELYGSKAAQWAKPKASGQLPTREWVHVFIPNDTAVHRALAILVDHAKEAYPHFESERGQQDIAAAEEALRNG